MSNSSEDPIPVLQPEPEQKKNYNISYVAMAPK
jgi:hypothetical protein